MILDLRIALGVLLLIGGGAINCQSAPSLPDPEKDSQMRDLIAEATRLVDGKKPQPAIEKCEKVIASFKAYYGRRPEKTYCARTSAESLGYLLKAAAENDQGTSREGKAIVLSSSWAEAYFIKAFALHDLGRIAESKSTIKLAIKFSPWNCKYLCELGSIYQIEKNWSKAKEAFEIAEG
jgi:tetratricopeptide (TPR) repeat protein